MCKVKSEKLLQTMLKYGERIHNSQIYIMFFFALAGAFLFTCGLIFSYVATESVINTIPEDISMIVVGFAAFTFFFHFTYILCLFKICAKQQKQIDELNIKMEKFEK